ncbi:MAG: class II fructose-bisphosphate aldolase [bacterium]|nr:class II fructose-bisphosphate aldolase [bacterium]
MNLKDYLNKAKKEKRAIGQFNFSTLDQLRGILKAAQAMKKPVILGTSEGELNYLGLEEVVALTEISKIKYNVFAFLNLDHGKDLDLIKRAVDYGFSAVHFDGSDLALEKNIEYAKKIVEYAHRKNVLVEGELDAIGEGRITSLEEAERFAKETRVDSLAIAIGNRHGYYKNVKLNFGRIEEINKRLNVFLVLHGGSGIPDKDIKRAITLGIVKINVNTELRMAWKQSLIKILKSREIKPYNILPKIEWAVQKKVEQKLKLFN